MAKYNRNYINLIEESKRYSKENKKLYGKCILEEKEDSNKIVVSTENLREGTYYVYLLVNQHGQYVAIPIDKLNNRLELKVQNKNTFIGDTKFLFKDILAVMIGTMENKKVIPVLVGYKKDKINYKHNFYIYNKGNLNYQEEKEEKKEIRVKYKDKERERVESVKINSMKEVKEENIANMKEDKLQKEVEKDLSKKEYQKEIINEKNKYNEKLESKVESNKENQQENCEEERANINDFFAELFSNKETTNENIFSNMLTRFKEEIEEIKYISEVSNNEFAKVNNNILQEDLTKKDGDINYIFKHNNEIKPFSKQNKNVTWVVIDLKELTVISNKCWELRRNTLILQGYSDYGHLILGRYEDEKNNNRNYLIGIPANYDENNILTAKKIGVVQYKPCDNPQLMESVPGYWIILK